MNFKQFCQPDLFIDPDLRYDKSNFSLIENGRHRWESDEYREKTRAVKGPLF